MSASASSVGVDDAFLASFAIVENYKAQVPGKPEPSDPEAAAERALAESLPDPLWAGALKAQEEITRFQADCKNPELQILIGEMLKLKQVNLALSEKEKLFTQLIQAYAEPLLKLVKYDLFQLIQGSPELKKRLIEYLDRYCSEDQQIDFRDVITQMERDVKAKPKREAQDDWALVGPNQETTMISLDLETFRELQQQIALIQSVLEGSTESKEFLMEIKTFRKKGGLTKPDEGWGTPYESAVTCYSIINGLAVVGRMAQAISPSLKTTLTLLFPGNSLMVLNLILTVLTAASEQ